MVLLGVTGSIAASKAVELTRMLKGAGHDVHVIQTAASLNFIDPSSFEAASGDAVAVDMFEGGIEPPFKHIELPICDLMIIAPATANTIGKMAAGIADNLLLSAYLAYAGPIVVCPAMNQRMWQHPAVQQNVETLVMRGIRLAGPARGELACGEEGIGRMSQPDEIFRVAQEILSSSMAQDLAGVNVLVTAGGTREPLDSVRYIANRSSGKMGFSLAEAAGRRGARVTVIAANCALPRQDSIVYVDVTTASEMQAALETAYEGCDVLLMAAAVSDYAVSSPEPMGKLDREENYHLHLVSTPDMLSALGNGYNGKLKVGFAAEYGMDQLERSRRKMREKGLDLIVFNDISRTDIGFEADDNEVLIMSPARDDLFISKASKTECANRILDQVVDLLSPGKGGRYGNIM